MNYVHFTSVWIGLVYIMCLFDQNLLISNQLSDDDVCSNPSTERRFETRNRANARIFLYLCQVILQTDNLPFVIISIDLMQVCLYMI